MPSLHARRFVRRLSAGVLVAVTLGAAAAPALADEGDAEARGSRYLAPGFDALPRDARVAVFPVDVALSSISAGGVPEPRADWTGDAAGFMKSALDQRISGLGLNALFVDEAVADEFAEQVGLQAAVARSIALHHGVAGRWALPTKGGRLDWSFDDAMKPIEARTGARYGLFVWVRDSYASAERKIAMVGLALLGVGLAGGSQVGYASLVDLDTGRVVWFNRLARGSGDLRDEKSAGESIRALMRGFPLTR